MFYNRHVQRESLPYYAMHGSHLQLVTGGDVHGFRRTGRLPCCVIKPATTCAIWREAMLEHRNYGVTDEVAPTAGTFHASLGLIACGNVANVNSTESHPRTRGTHATRAAHRDLRSFASQQRAITCTNTGEDVTERRVGSPFVSHPFWVWRSSMSLERGKLCFSINLFVFRCVRYVNTTNSKGYEPVEVSGLGAVCIFFLFASFSKSAGLHARPMCCCDF